MRGPIRPPNWSSVSAVATREDRPPGSTHRQVDLAHVDLGTEAIMPLTVHAAATGSGPAYVIAALNLRREAEVHAEIRVAFFTFGIKDREGRQQTGANADGAFPAKGIGSTATHIIVDEEGVHVAAECEAPAVAHLHRQLCRA